MRRSSFMHGWALPGHRGDNEGRAAAEGMRLRVFWSELSRVHSPSPWLGSPPTPPASRASSALLEGQGESPGIFEETTGGRSYSTSAR
jgi:hypothetical protein